MPLSHYDTNEIDAKFKALDIEGLKARVKKLEDSPATPTVPELPPANGESSVTTVATLKAREAIAAEKEHIILEDGNYNFVGRHSFSRRGVVIRAKNIGGAKFTGSPISSSAPEGWLQGLDIRTLSDGVNQIVLSGANAVFSRNIVNLNDQNIADSRWIQVRAPNVRIDHNDIGGKKTKGQMIRADEQAAAGIKILDNNIHDFVRSPDDAEAIILGLSTLENFEFNAEVARNRFYKTDGEPEIITIKSSKNYIHDNTFEDTKDAALTNRHGHNNRYEDNVFIRSGFRLFGTGHSVKRNMMIDSPNGQGTSSLVIGGGGTTGSYIAVKDSVFERNIIVQTIVGAVPLMLGYQQAGAATNNTFKENIIYGTVGTLTGTSGSSAWTGQTMDGNIVYAVPPAKPGNMPALNVDPKLEKQADNTYKYKYWKQGKYLAKTDVGPSAS